MSVCQGVLLSLMLLVNLEAEGEQGQHWRRCSPCHEDGGANCSPYHKRIFSVGDHEV